MLLLLLPLVCVAGVYKWGKEKPVFSKQNFKNYFTIFGVLALALLVGQGSDMLAYSKTEWKKFDEFFMNRTELYDFQTIPEYDTNVTFYNSIGLNASEVELLHNYNFGLSEKIDEKVIGEIATYAAGLRGETKTFSENLREKTELYFYLMTNGGEHGDFPHNALIILGYTALLGLGLIQGKLSHAIFNLFLLVSVRSGLWLYILMGERNPPRISHSLYFIEMGILLAMLLSESVVRRAKTFPPVIAVIALTIALTNIPSMISAADTEFLTRNTTNKPWIAMQKYVEMNPDNFYFIDVYSSVPYNEKIFSREKIFGGQVNQPANYDIMGGWACKSPLYQKQLAHFFGPGMTMEKALVTLDNVYFINDQNRDNAWLSAYYQEQGQNISLEMVDVIADKLEVYKLR
jgi:hypothetical protein